MHRPTRRRRGPLPAPTLDDVRVEDLKDTGRLLGLLDQAVARGLSSPSEADRLRFVAAAEHAPAVGSGNPARAVRPAGPAAGSGRYLTQDDEDAASRPAEARTCSGARVSLARGG